MARKKAAISDVAPAIQRGLATYLPGHEQDPDGKMTVLVPLAEIDGQITVKNARKQGKDLQAFCDSIREEGLLQPIVVAAKPDGCYQLVFGRHRVLAHKLLGLERIPAIVRKDMTAGDQHIAAAIENLQRADIDTWEEAVTYAAALEDPKVTRKALAERVGVNPSTVTQRMKLHALGSKYGPWAATLRQEDVEILAAFHEHPQVMEAACKAAKSTQGYGLRMSVRRALRDRDDICMPYEGDFIEKHAGVQGYTDVDRVEKNQTYKKAIKALPGIKVAGGYQALEFCLDPSAARAACKAAGDRLRGGQKASASKAVSASTGGVDIVKRAQNRAVKAQDEAMATHLKGIVSFGRNWHQEFLKRWLKSEGLIASTKAKRAAFAELTGITSWSGRAEELVKHIEKHGWGTPEADRILAAVLHFTNANWQPYVSDPAAQITTGRTWKGLMDKATREVKAELKAAEERKKAKAAKKTPANWGRAANAPSDQAAKKAAKKTKGKAVLDKMRQEVEADATAERAKQARKANLAEQKAKPHACIWGPCRERYENADDLLEHDKVCPVRLKHEAAKAVPDAPAVRPGAGGGKECPNCLVVVKAFRKAGKRFLACSCTPEEGVVVP